MKEFWNIIWLSFTTIGRWIGYLLGGYDGLLYTLIAFVIANYATSVMCGIADKKISVMTEFRAIEKKILIFLLVGLTNILDVQVINTDSALRTVTILFYISNEGMSLLDNVTYLGLPIPEKLKAVLDQIYGKTKSDTNKENQLK